MDRFLASLGNSRARPGEEQVTPGEVHSFCAIVKAWSLLLLLCAYGSKKRQALAGRAAFLRSCSLRCFLRILR